MKIKSLVVILGALVTFQSVLAADFSDTPPSHPNYEAIMDLKANGVIEGYPDGTFKPEQAVNRVEALKIILSGSNIDVVGSTSTALFFDTNADEWYAEYLNKAVELGIVEGYSDGTFKPTQTVNLVENLKILLLANGIDVSNTSVSTNPYNDAYTGQWYSGYVQYAKDKKLIDADSNNRVYPAQGMTRGKLAEAMHRLSKAQSPTTTEEPTEDHLKVEIEELLAVIAPFEKIEEYYPYLSEAKLNEVKNLITMIDIDGDSSTLEIRKSMIKSSILPGDLTLADTLAVNEDGLKRRAVLSRTEGDITVASCVGLVFEDNAWKIDSYKSSALEIVNVSCMSETANVGLLDTKSLVTGQISYSSEYDFKAYLNGYYILEGGLVGGISTMNLPLKEGKNELSVIVGESMKQYVDMDTPFMSLAENIVGLELSLKVDNETVATIESEQENMSGVTSFMF